MIDNQSVFYIKKEPKWSMSIGNFTIYHVSEYSRWRAFWLRFMGWEVAKIKGNTK
jgi:hypothetical protein